MLSVGEKGQKNEYSGGKTSGQNPNQTLQNNLSTSIVGKRTKQQDSKKGLRAT